MLTFGSVCSGIEAASVAWHPLGWRAAWLSEIEPFPCAVLAHHYPEVPNLGDMTTLPDRVLSRQVAAPDVFCGGTPCQAFSVAGMRRSLADARGNLSLVFCGVANAIDHVRAADGKPAAVIVWENVPGVLSTKDNAFGCFLAGLAGEDDPLVPPGGKWANAGCVFGPSRTVAWRTLDAQHFGLAQRRKRVFVVASARAGFDPAAVLFEWDGVRRDTAPSREARQEAAGRAGSGAAFGGNRTSGPIDVAPALLAQPGSGWKGDFESEAFITTHTLRGEGFDASEDGTGRGTPLVPVASSAKDYGGDAMTDLSPTLRAGGHNTSHANAGVMPAIAFHPTQDPISRTDGTTHARGCGSSGGQASVAVCIKGAAIGRKPEAGPQYGETLEECAYTQNCVEVHAVQHAMQVRRLTPRECERLMGFPDDYTMIPWRIWQQANKKGHSYESLLAAAGMKLREPATDECPDGPRYKALGNSWAVPVVRWIGTRIEQQLKGTP